MSDGALRHEVLEDKDVLVTGGAGFIGSNLALALVQAGANVRVLDDLSTGSLDNLADHVDELEFMEGDIRDIDVLRSALEGQEIVFHLAALPSVPRSIEDPFTSSEVNAQGTLKVLLASRDAGIGRLVYASSSSIYGDSPALPKTEELPVDPKSPYALSKYCGERYCQLFHRLYGLETVCLRYFNVFGPRQDPASQYAAVIPRFITRALSGAPITIHGDGEQTRDFSYVENVVEANLLAAGAPDAAGEVLNIACGQSTTVKQLAAFVSEKTGREVEIEWAPTRQGDVRDSLACIEKAHSVLGYRPGVDVYEGLARTIHWFRDVGDVALVHRR